MTLRRRNSYPIRTVQPRSRDALDALATARYIGLGELNLTAVPALTPLARASLSQTALGFRLRLTATSAFLAAVLMFSGAKAYEARSDTPITKALYASVMNVIR